MADSDVKVREVRLLESYSTAYNRFMEATIHMTYRFRNHFSLKEDEARDLVRKINGLLNRAEHELYRAQCDYEAFMRRGKVDDYKERAYIEEAVEKYEALYKKAQNYAESARKLYQNIHGEMERIDWMSSRQRNKLEQSKDEGNGFLNKAISALKEYKQ